MTQEFENIDSINNENEEVTFEETTPEVDVEKLKETNSKLYTRTKNAENELKEARMRLKELESKASINNKSFVSKEDLDLAIIKNSKGYDDETIEQLQVISKGKGISLIQAQEDSLFKLLLEKKEREVKETQAKLGSSKGASSTQSQKISEMTREEHMAFAKEMA